MPGIYDGISDMTDDEIRMSIAIFRKVTFMNAAKETGKRFVGAVADIANALTEAFTRKTPFEYQITRVYDLVMSEYVLLKGKDREQLEYELNVEIKKCCSELAGTASDDDISRDRISFLLINEAARLYNIEKYMTPANKIEKISIEYNNAFLQVLHNELQKQTPEQVKKCDMKIQNRLNAISLDAKRELQKRLMPKEFSGQGIGRILRLERTCKYLTYAVDILGTDCFDETDINIRVVYDAIKSLKKIPRVLCAQFVWSVRKARGRKFTIDKEILPGYIPADKKTEFLNEEKIFRGLLRERTESKEKLDKCEEEAAKLSETTEKLRTRMELDQREYDEAQMHFMSLESKKDAYVSGHMLKDDTKKYYNDVNEAKRQLDRAQDIFDKSRQKLLIEESKLSKLREEQQLNELNFNVSKSKSEKKVREIAEQLKKNWCAYYFRFKFNEDLFENVVVDFDSEQRSIIEEMLKEMHDSNSPEAYYISIKQTDVGQEEQEEQVAAEKIYVTYCSVSAGVNAQIEYSDNRILRICRQ